jgi:F5/8 type C domain
LWRLGLGGSALLLITPFAIVATVNWALSGTATATTEEPANPAANAIDGDAGTDWCTSGWTGTLTVDLGQVRALDDLGITMDPASPSACPSRRRSWPRAPRSATRAGRALR